MQTPHPIPYFDDAQELLRSTYACFLRSLVQSMEKPYQDSACDQFPSR